MSLLSILLPGARAKVLQLLFAPGQGEIYLRELARLVGMSVAAVQKEANYLGEHDLIIPRRDGNRVYYRANKQQPFFPELQALVIKTSGFELALKSAFQGTEGIDLAFIFGSVATGRERATSDIDLMLVGSVGLRPLAAPLREASQQLGREINPHVLSAQEWKKKLTEGDPFLQRVLASEKIWIQGNPDELERLGK